MIVKEPGVVNQTKKGGTFQVLGYVKLEKPIVIDRLDIQENVSKEGKRLVMLKCNMIEVPVKDLGETFYAGDPQFGTLTFMAPRDRETIKAQG